MNENRDLVNANWTQLLRTGLGVSFKTLIIVKDPRKILFDQYTGKKKEQKHHESSIQTLKYYCEAMVDNWHQIIESTAVLLQKMPTTVLTKDDMLTKKYFSEEILKIPKFFKIEPPTAAFLQRISPSNWIFAGSE